jgi:hypothetical protein
MPHAKVDFTPDTAQICSPRPAVHQVFTQVPTAASRLNVTMGITATPLVPSTHTQSAAA